MEIRYFNETDTLTINFSNKDIVETRDINENVLIELDKDGGIVSITIEHAKEQADVKKLLYQQVA
jgi:uncharacterized protein YuzE